MKITTETNVSALVGQFDSGDDLGILGGADSIAKVLWPHIYRENPKKALRRVYHLSSESKDETNRLPIFRIGTLLCARPAAIRKWIEEQEKRGGAPKDSSDEELPPAPPPALKGGRIGRRRVRA